MHVLQAFVAYLGRVFLSIIFLFSALVEIWDFATTEQYYNTIFTRWMHLYQGNEAMGLWLANVLSWLPAIIITSIVLKFLGGLLLIIGYKVRLGAFLLFLCALAEITFICDFWHLTGPEQTSTMVMFFKNLSIVGGLMIVMAFGKGGSKKEAST